ncbi:hypothetical protein Q4Q35_10890 [Flavivirga aquimarina]|uniref:Uncharacterized protein n=1 Tax=Flavivirga aquimarina TaxID=2027862 RepID=A0ABT8WB61_9FLAO|nr:hypothetical protein [Flavivirga aquimarina]MDO5970312.1 hypothetical protein [Flavivirga aquimarina]
MTNTNDDIFIKMSSELIKNGELTFLFDANALAKLFSNDIELLSKAVNNLSHSKEKSSRSAILALIQNGNTINKILTYNAFSFGAFKNLDSETKTLFNSPFNDINIRVKTEIDLTQIKQGYLYKVVSFLGPSFIRKSQKARDDIAKIILDKEYPKGFAWFSGSLFAHILLELDNDSRYEILMKAGAKEVLNKILWNTWPDGWNKKDEQMALLNNVLLDMTESQIHDLTCGMPMEILHQLDFEKNKSHKFNELRIDL